MNNNEHTFSCKIDESLAEQAIADRRWFHQHAELSNQEFETTAYIADAMRKLGLEIYQPGKTGLIAVLKGAQDGPVLGIRADIDALPIQEETDVPYKSMHDGVMHACGHDAHAAALIAAARYLCANKEQLHGTVKFVFQPAEEYLPCGGPVMTGSGLLDDCTSFLGFHVQSMMPVGKFNAQSGAHTAASCSINIGVRGKGGHGGIPQTAIDATVAAASVLMNLQTFVSREMNPNRALVMSIGTFHSGTAKNIISEYAYMEGTIRYYDEDEFEHFTSSLKRIAENTAAAFGATAEVTFIPGLDAVVNDEKMASLGEKVSVKLRGEDSLLYSEKGTGCDDFCYYSKMRPSLYVDVGGMNPEKVPTYPHHNPRFGLDEDCVINAAEFISQYAIDFCW